MHASARHIRISPKKANLTAQIVRNMPVQEALDVLKFTPKKGADMLAKVIQAAAANAEHNFKQDPSKLYIKEINVSKGVTFKRSVPISRGRVHPILKFSSHIIVDLAVQEAPKEEKAKKSKAKA